ncbi:MAG TPA: glycosyltransferase family 2 protein [Candidatus Binatia bacterium]
MTAPTTQGPLVGIVVPTWNRAADAARCLASVARLEHRRRRVFVVDNGSVPAERAALRAALATEFAGAEQVPSLIALPENRGFAAAVNAGLAAAFEAGCSATLVLNDDAEVEPDLLGLLLAGAGVDPAAGVVAPCVLDSESGREVSRGERVSVPLVCWPRTWLRVRRASTTPYRVSGVLGAAFLLTRACWTEVGGLAEPYFAYYEEVDYWLRLRAAGFAIVVVPAARVRHRGFRGFKGGFTPLAAYLKARNLPLLVRRNGTPLDWAAFLPAYLVLLVASAAGYAWRAHGGAVVAAMLRGARDAWHAAAGPPPAALVPPTAA